MTIKSYLPAPEREREEETFFPFLWNQLAWQFSSFFPFSVQFPNHWWRLSLLSSTSSIFLLSLFFFFLLIYLFFFLLPPPPSSSSSSSTSPSSLSLPYKVNNKGLFFPKNLLEWTSAWSRVYTSNLFSHLECYLGKILSLYEAIHFGQILTQTLCLIPIWPK